jgi:hypothetical protein
MKNIRKLTEQEVAYINYLKNNEPHLAGPIEKMLRCHSYRENGKTIFINIGE